MKQLTSSAFRQTWITTFNKRCADVSALLNIVLVLLVIADIVSRYVFSATSAWVMELEWHFFAAIVLLAAPYTLAADEHVRVDLFYSRFSAKDKGLVNILGHLVFLIPWCLVVIYYSAGFAYEAWIHNEGSSDSGGLPYRFIVKALIPLGFVLLLLQSLADIREHWINRFLEAN